MKNQRLIVSLTSYPARIRFVPEVVESLKKQTRKPDEVMLYLASENFPEGEAELPRIFRALIQDHDVTVRWVEGDLKSHKKYYYAFREFPEDLIVTVDDDAYYAPDLLETLWRTHERFPSAVATGRANLITLDAEGRLRPSPEWIERTMGFEDSPSMQLMSIGVGGALYDPSLFPPALYDREAILKLCPEDDDLWLKAIEALAGIPVVRAPLSDIISLIPGSQSATPFQQSRARRAPEETLGGILSHLSPSENLLEKAIRKSVDPKAITLEEVLAFVNSDKRRYADALEARDGLEEDQARRTIIELRAENDRIFDLREHERDMNIAKNAEIEKLRQQNAQQKEQNAQQKEQFREEKEKMNQLRAQDREHFEKEKAQLQEEKAQLREEIDRQMQLREHEKAQNLAKNQQIEQLRADQKQRLAELREEHMVRVTELKEEFKKERNGLRQQVAMLRYCLDHPILSRVDKTKQTLFPKKKKKKK